MNRHRNIALFVPHLGCPHRCTFCNQNAISGTDAPPTPADVTAACTQAAAQWGEDAAQSQLAFFGGSFTAVERHYMCSLLDAAQPFLQRGELGSIRISTRPDCVADEVLGLLWAKGVRSIELGAQSMDEEVLRLSKRGHTAAQVEDAARRIQAHGFSLGLQMMLGLEGDTPAGAWQTARQLAALQPAEVRIYPTVVLGGTKLCHRMEEGLYTPLTLEEGIPLAAQLMEFFEEQGIAVIRVGLHASQELEEQMAGGCYHPAFRELCQSYLLEQTLQEQLIQLPAGPVRLEVHPRSRSLLSGQGGRILQQITRQGYRPTVVENEAIPRRQIRVQAL